MKSGFQETKWKRCNEKMKLLGGGEGKKEEEGQSKDSCKKNVA